MKPLVGTFASLVLALGLGAARADDSCGAPASSTKATHKTQVAASTEHRASSSSPTEADFRNAMRKLWEDHITWTRLFIVSAAADLPDKTVTTNRLLKNQTDIGNAIKPYYGSEAGTKLTALLKDHITIAAEVVAAAKADNKAKLDDANKRWFANADDIAQFLSTANPNNWPEADVRTMMHDHLKLTTKEAVAQLTGDYAGSVAAYDEVHEQILVMADGLSDGIVAQFPEKF